MSTAAAQIAMAPAAPPTGPSGLKRLSKSISPAARAARDELILTYLPLVTTIAARVHQTLPVHVELDDLIHAGVIGLFDAATKFDVTKQIAFPTYAKHRIKGAILDSLRELDFASRDMRRRFRQMEEVKHALAAHLKRDPTQAEIAQSMGLSTERWCQLMVAFRNIGLAAAQARIPDRDEQAPPDPPCAIRHHPDNVFAQSELREQLGTALNTLPRRYQQVVTLYYDHDMTMKEIGNVLGVNESRVSQIHKSALARMQTALESQGIASAGAF